jgi:opacity protein-like surface antigen
MKFKNLIVCCLALVLFASLSEPASAQDAKAYLHFYGGLNWVLEYGCDCDYELGVNDFPKTPKHTTGSVGMSFGYFLGKGFALELDARYHTNAEVSLTDPSDGDRVTIDTAKHYSITANVLYEILKGGVRPYVLAGAGIDTLVDVETKTFPTELGFEFELKEPDQKTDFMYNLGCGLVVQLTQSLGIRLDARYVNIPETDDHDTIQSINAAAGLSFRF